MTQAILRLLFFSSEFIQNEYYQTGKQIDNYNFYGKKNIEYNITYPSWKPQTIIQRD